MERPYLPAKVPTRGFRQQLPSRVHEIPAYSSSRTFVRRRPLNSNLTDATPLSIAATSRHRIFPHRHFPHHHRYPPFQTTTATRNAREDTDGGNFEHGWRSVSASYPSTSPSSRRRGRFECVVVPMPSPVLGRGITISSRRPGRTNLKMAHFPVNP